MNERQWWAKHVRPQWHAPRRGRVAWHVQDHANPGLLDSVNCFGGVACLVETKFRKFWHEDPSKPLDDINLTTEQRRHAEEWLKARGYAFVLLGIEDERQWYLVPPGLYGNFQEGPSRQQVEAGALLSTNGRQHDWKTLYKVPLFIMHLADGALSYGGNEERVVARVGEDAPRGAV